jgi:prolipoprotein diacylglyceryltransferase
MTGPPWGMVFDFSNQPNGSTFLRNLIPGKRKKQNAGTRHPVFLYHKIWDKVYFNVCSAAASRTASVIASTTAKAVAAAATKQQYDY